MKIPFFVGIFCLNAVFSAFARSNLPIIHTRINSLTHILDDKNSKSDAGIGLSDSEEIGGEYIVSAFLSFQYDSFGFRRENQSSDKQYKPSAFSKHKETPRDLDADEYEIMDEIELGEVLSSKKKSLGGDSDGSSHDDNDDHDDSE